MNSKNATISLNLASVLPVGMLEAELVRRMMNMTLADLAKLAGAPSVAKPAKKPVKQKAKPAKKPTKKVVKKPVKAKRNRRALTPIRDRIDAFLKGATNEWQSLSFIAAVAGVDMPGGDARRAMLNGYSRDGIDFPPVLEWNGQPTQAARYRLIDGADVPAVL